jgi:hypothetical protein
MPPSPDCPPYGRRRGTSCPGASLARWPCREARKAVPCRRKRSEVGPAMPAGWRLAKRHGGVKADPTWCARPASRFGRHSRPYGSDWSRDDEHDHQAWPEAAGCSYRTSFTEWLAEHDELSPYSRLITASTRIWPRFIGKGGWPRFLNLGVRRTHEARPDDVTWVGVRLSMIRRQSFMTPFRPGDGLTATSWDFVPPVQVPVSPTLPTRSTFALIDGRKANATPGLRLSRGIRAPVGRPHCIVILRVNSRPR